MTEKGYWTYNSILPSTFRCISTGSPSFDAIYCHNEESGESGLARGAMSVWSGSPGVGKTRLTITVVKAILANGVKILYFENEFTVQQFKAHYKIYDPNNLLVISNETSLNNMNSIALSVKPDLIIVDSINKIEHFNSLTFCPEIFNEFRKTIEEIDAHIIFVSQLNKQGQTKGSNDVEHLADIVVRLTKCEVVKKLRNDPAYDSKDMFVLKVAKNRFGSSDNWLVFKHVQEGVKCCCPNSPSGTYTLEDVIRGVNEKFSKDRIKQENTQQTYQTEDEGWMYKFAKRFGVI